MDSPIVVDWKWVDIADTPVPLLGIVYPDLRIKFAIVYHTLI